MQQFAVEKLDLFHLVCSALSIVIANVKTGAVTLW